MTNNRLLFISMLLIAALFSCKKDKGDEEDPVITIQTPTEGQAFNVYDFVTVQADVSDNKQLVSVSIGLIDDHYSSVQNLVEIPVEKKSITFTRSYEINNIHLESGTYFIWVVASDGENTTNAYQRIEIIAVPKKLKGIYAVCKTSSLLTSINKVDSAYNVVALATPHNTDYSGSSISSYDQMLYLSGKNTGDTKAIDIENGSVRWSIPFPLSAAPHCHDNYNSNRIIYVAYRAGTINGYDYNAISYFSANAISGYYPEKISKIDKFVLSEQKSLTIGTPKLVVYLPTGIQVQETNLTQDVLAVFQKEKTKAFVFGNNASQQSAMEIYDITGNSFWAPHLMPAAKLLSVEQVDTNAYLLGFDDNSIYKYTYHNNSLLSYLSGIKPVRIQYNEADNEVIVADDKKLWCYDYPSATYKNSTTLPDTILNFHLLYNR